MKRPRLGKAILPPEGAPRCSVCLNFAWDGSIAMHAVRFGGAWHHPSCPQIRQARPRFDRVPGAPPAPSAVQRMLLLFRPLGIVLFYLAGSTVLALAVVAACAWLSGCAEVARDAYEHDLRQCAIDNKGKPDAEYEACKRRVKSEWHVDAGGIDGSE